MCIVQVYYMYIVLCKHNKRELEWSSLNIPNFYIVNMKKGTYSGPRPSMNIASRHGISAESFTLYINGNYTH